MYQYSVAKKSNLPLLQENQLLKFCLKEPSLKFICLNGCLFFKKNGCDNEIRAEMAAG